MNTSTPLVAIVRGRRQPVEVGGAVSVASTTGAAMLADLDLLPSGSSAPLMVPATGAANGERILKRRGGRHALRRAGDHGHPVSVSSPRRGSSSCHLFPVLPKRPGHRERGERLSDAIEALGGVFAHDSPGSQANLLLVDSTPIESARSVETTRR